jgi:hypothetical protein
MNINEAFPSKYLKAADIEGSPIVTIAGIENEEVGKDKEVRPVLYFEGEDKGIILNKTNATNISKAYGYETDDWIGKQVQIGTTMVDFQGQSVEAIRIYPPKRAAAGTGKKFGQNDQSPQPGGNRQFSDQSAGPREFAPLDDDIPF